MKRFWAASLLLVAVLAASCSGSTTLERVAGEVAPERTVVESDVSDLADEAEPAAEPEPTAVELDDVDDSEPEAAPEPTEVESDDTPVLVEGDGWTITQGDMDRLIAFVEETHQLSFAEPVGIAISDDIGAEFARGFEPFGQPDWLLMRGLGLAETDAERQVVNQARLDRIRGFCCSFDESGRFAVVVELQPSKIYTEMIVVHELTHALHAQNDLQPRGIVANEIPLPAASAFEGVPQFITFAYMQQEASTELIDEISPDLPIIRDDQFDQMPVAAARNLNFAYGAGAEFVDAVVAELGVDGLSELMRRPPSTGEQVLFPQKYLDVETARSVPPPSPPAGTRVQHQGTVGAATWRFLLLDAYGPDESLELVAPWSGDGFVVYTGDGKLCLAADVVLDTEPAAAAFAEALVASVSTRESSPELDYAVDATTVMLTMCRPG